MPSPLRMLPLFVVAFGSVRAFTVWISADPFALGPFAADVLGPAAVATALYWMVERRRARIAERSR